MDDSNAGHCAHLAFMWVTQTMGGIHFSIARHWQPLMTSIIRGQSSIIVWQNGAYSFSI